MNRREIVKGMAVAPLAMAGGSMFAKNQAEMNQLMESIPDKMTVLFQGDSITDAGRNRADYYPNQVTGMGNGYVHQIVCELLGRHPQVDFRIYNRGISGHKASDLLDRWRDDCLILRPTVLSLMIGVNDFWHTVEGMANVTSEEFTKNLRFLIKRTQSSNKDVKLIIGEPFAVKGGTAITDKWADFAVFQAAVKSVAEEFGATFLPYQTIFDEALEDAPVEYWAPDGVHPTMAGAYLMRQAWLKAFYRLFI